MQDFTGGQKCLWCGHCKEGQDTLLMGPAETAVKRRVRPQQSSSELGLAFKVVPAWGWVLIIGINLVAAASLYADYKLPENSRERALWSTFQVLGGLMLCWVAGWLVASRDDILHEPLGVTDILFPDRLWWLAFKKLPATRWYVCFGVWAAMASVLGIFWPGGLTYWLPPKSEPQEAKKPFKGPKKNGLDTLTKSAEAFGNKGSENLGNDLNRNEGNSEKKPEEPGPISAPQRTLLNCIIVGYTMQEGLVNRLHVSRLVKDHLYYLGIVPVPKNQEESKYLLERLGPLKANAPVFPDLKARANWVKPRLYCEVESAGLDENDRLKDPVFMRLLPPKQPQPAQPPTQGVPADKGVKDDGKSARDAGKGEPSSPK